jgi:hypothetical protein
MHFHLPFYLRRLLELFFYAPSLEDLGGFVIFEEKIISSKPLFKWHDMVMTMDILAVDTYSGRDLCMPI